jgi:hypothetical protein
MPSVIFAKWGPVWGHRLFASSGGRQVDFQAVIDEVAARGMGILKTQLAVEPALGTLASPALADKADDYVCLIGRAAVALYDGIKADAAQRKAYRICGVAPALEENEADGIGDFVILAVEAIAERLR